MRGGWLAHRFADFERDPDGYRLLAASLSRHGVFGYPVVVEEGGARDSAPIAPTAFRPPLYPLLLAACGGGDSRLATALLHLALGVGTVLLTYRLARCWGLGSGSLAAAALVTVDPILLNQSSLYMTETLAAFLAVVALVALHPRGAGNGKANAALAGVAMGVAVLCRPTFLPWLLLVVPASCAAPASEPLRHRLTRGAVMLAAAALTLSPWVLRNTWVFGRPLVGTTHGGYTLLLGNNPDFYDFLPQALRGGAWDSRELDARYNAVKAGCGGDEWAADRWAYERAGETIRQRPARFAQSVLFRITRLWGCLPSRRGPSESTLRQLARWAVGAWYTTLHLLAFVAALRLGLRLWRIPWHAAATLALAFTLVHSLYWTDMRMRAPLIPVICLLAVAGVAGAAGGAAQRSTGGSSRRR